MPSLSDTAMTFYRTNGYLTGSLKDREFAYLKTVVVDVKRVTDADKQFTYKGKVRDIMATP